MDCKAFLNDLDEWLDGEPGGASSSEMEQHLVSCASCRTDRDAQVRFRAQIGSVEIPSARPGFIEKLPARAAEMAIACRAPAPAKPAAVAQTRNRIARPRLIVDVIASAAAAAAILVTLILLQEGPQRPGPAAVPLPEESLPEVTPRPEPGPRRPVPRVDVESLLAAFSKAAEGEREAIVLALRELPFGRESGVLRGFSSGNPDVVAGAIEAAAEFRMRGACGRLTAMALSGSGSEAAVFALSRIDPDAARETVKTMLADPRLRRAAIVQVHKLADPVFAAPLAALLLEEPADLAVVEALKATGPKGVASLEKDLGSPDARKAAAALKAIAVTGHGSAFAVVSAGCLKRRELRAEAISVLGAIGDPSAVPALMDLLSNRETVPAVASAVAAIGARAVPALKKELLSARPGRARDALLLLGGVRHPDAVAAIAKSMRTRSLRREAVAALGMTGDPSAVEILVEAMTDREIAAAAALALGRIRDSRALEPLVALLQKPGMGSTAAAALGLLGDATAVPALVNAMRHASTRSAAHRALVEIVGEDLGRDSHRWARWWKERSGDPDRDAAGHAGGARPV